MSRLTLVLLAVALLSCQPGADGGGDAARKAWTTHLQNAERAQKNKRPELAEIELHAALRFLAQAPDERRTYTRALAALARLKGAKREYAAAGSLFEASIAVQLQNLDEVVSGDLVTDMGQLALVRNLQEDFAGADSLLARILNMREQGIVNLEPYDANYYLLLDMKANVARGRAKPTDSLLADSLQALSAVYWEYTLGFEAHAHDQYGKAAKHYGAAIAGADSALGATHPDIARFCLDLAAVYAVQGRLDQAGPLLQRAVGILEGTDESLALAAALDALADTFERSNHPEQARTMRDRSAALRRRLQERAAAGKG